ncbi:hypothetical protein AZE42_08390 [Rhizopogon vesiculosus]|uniref:Uncharacterized protein n=1 Tax=Rhizopogon vesiculosus TaxID=180088 RepID=A0A1J8QAX9_9AGAM|nr:hypothetical protein AZE42_08390 [Rhizopogon vesiculosus]
MTTEKRKPRDKPAPYQRQLKKPKVKDAPATSAHPTTCTSSCPNLTLSDWLSVFAYVDAHPAMPQCDILTTVENEVATSLQDLKNRNRIFGEPPSLDEFLEPAEEQGVGDSLEFEGGDKAIVAAVKQELAERAGEVIEIESDEEEDPEPEVSRVETLALCRRLEGACLQFGLPTST